MFMKFKYITFCRCSYFLPLKLSKICSRLKHKFAEKLLMEIERHGSRSSKLHKKVDRCLCTLISVFFFGEGSKSSFVRFSTFFYIVMNLKVYVYFGFSGPCGDTDEKCDYCLVYFFERS